MSEKKPVYNGYEEMYGTIKDLKKKLKDHYYTSGPCHNVVVAIKIPDYLDYVKLDKTSEYRILISNAFCIIRDKETDKKLLFFGHRSKENVNYKGKYGDYKIVKRCPECGAPTKFRECYLGCFMGCSNYPKCKKTNNIPTIKRYNPHKTEDWKL